MKNAGCILVVDDEPGVRTALQGILEDEGYIVEGVETGEEALRCIERNHYDALLLDVWLPGKDGIDVLEDLRERTFPGAIVMISGHGTIETAVKATKLGAFDFLEKPLSLERTVLVVQNAIRQKALEWENRCLRQRFAKESLIVGESKVMQELREQIKMAAPTNSRVLIQGENGTGKELVAKAVHQLSLRSKSAFVVMNCAAIPEDLVESELFGHKKGAFTGATDDKLGKFHVADGGTLFLDEIGDMSLKSQSKVLRVLEQQQFTPVGGGEQIEVDVRVLAATNKRLEEAIEQGLFREDLFYRINVIPISVPPLRVRDDDIERLAEYFLQMFVKENARPAMRIDEDAMKLMREYDWPGNVRELKNIIERLVIMNPNDSIGWHDLPDSIRGSSRSGRSFAHSTQSLKEARESYEREYILQKLEENGGNIARTARALRIERSSLYRKLSAFSISAKREKRN